MTNASGVATSTVVAANGIAGSYTVTASAPGVLAPAGFLLTNTAGPGITSLDPPSFPAGHGPFTLKVHGVRFAPSTVVIWSGEPLETTYASSEELTAVVPARLVAGGGTANVSVIIAGVSSDPAPFQVFIVPETFLTGVEPTPLPTQPVTVGLLLGSPAPGDS